jgi:hypothetical protein
MRCLRDVDFINLIAVKPKLIARLERDGGIKLLDDGGALEGVAGL